MRPMAQWAVRGAIAGGLGAAGVDAVDTWVMELPFVASFAAGALLIAMILLAMDHLWPVAPFEARASPGAQRLAKGLSSSPVALAALGALSMALVVPLTPGNYLVRAVVLALGLAVAVLVARASGRLESIAGYLLGAVPLLLIIPVTDGEAAGWTVRILTAALGVAAAWTLSLRPTQSSLEIPA